MRLTDQVFIIFLLASATFGCSSQFAGPLLNNDMMYMAKPLESDSVQWGTYASGNICISRGFKPKDINTFSEINLYESYTFDYGSIALGTFGYKGSYSLDEDSSHRFAVLHPYLGRYSYYGGGFRGSFNFTIPTDGVDFRVFGVDVVWSKEWGKYGLLRETIQHLPEMSAITEDELLSIAITSEICIRQRPENQLSFKLYFGHIHKGQLQSLEEYSNEPINFVSANVHYTYNSLFVVGQASLLENAGIKLGLGYRIW